MNVTVDVCAGPFATFRCKAIHIELHPETKAGAAQAAGMNKALGRGDVTDYLSATFTEETSKGAGKDERTIRRAPRLGEGGVGEGALMAKGALADLIEGAISPLNWRRYRRTVAYSPISARFE